mmetsp:Transcript_3873/g.5328  ORF Transcript_3873/g.5328 Transcript_3873/m.5328 type:complete len:453 (+) Transcript_3873:62-1420(+)
MSPFGFIRIVVCVFSLISASYAFKKSHRVSCTHKKLCNGNLMCALVCEKGTVDVDEWTSNALQYQRGLQFNEELIYSQLPSTHNSAINEADGFGIEKYFISALQGGSDLDEGDDIGEGVCQYLSMTDQLRIGIRHLEIDIWWGPVNREIEVCHSPVPLYPVGNISRTASAAGLDLEWQPLNMSCVGTKRTFEEVLREVKQWLVLPENSQEVVVLFLDTKFRLTPEQVTQGNEVIRKVFGSLLWAYTDGSPLTHTVREMVTRNKRVVIENNKDSWLSPAVGQPLVFYPTLWTHQFGASSFQEFPSCVVEGDSSWFGSQWVRALDGSFLEAASRCGVQLASSDYVNPDDMQLLVWSWQQGQPKGDGGDCVAMGPAGRWLLLDCEEQLPYACLTAGNSSKPQWAVDLSVVGGWGSSRCGSGSEFAAPSNGYSNALLLNAGFAQKLWLNAVNPLAI